jgi:RecJ-like exonuclease
MIKRRKRAKPEYVCPKCRGTGNAPKGKIVGVCTGPGKCPECKGTGKVKSRPLDDVDVLYDSFTKKDMTRVQFRRALLKTLDPMRSHRDLERMVTRQRTKLMNTIRIERGLSGKA